MSALQTALPLALTAALYPPALLTLILLLSGKHPRGLVLAHFLGALLMVVGVGLIGLAVLKSTSSSSSNQASSTTSGWVRHRDRCGAAGAFRVGVEAMRARSQAGPQPRRRERGPDRHLVAPGRRPARSGRSRSGC